MDILNMSQRNIPGSIKLELHQQHL